MTVRDRSLLHQRTEWFLPRLRQTPTRAQHDSSPSPSVWAWTAAQPHRVHSRDYCGSTFFRPAFRPAYLGIPAATQAVMMSCSASETQAAGRGVVKQLIDIGIQPSMIAGTVHSPIFFGIVLSTSMKQPAGASRLCTGLNASSYVVAMLCAPRS